MPEGASPTDEVVVQLADGWSLRSGVYSPSTAQFTSGEYVRLCRPDGSEYAYWDQAEWATDPALVMGAIINSAAGLRFWCNHDPVAVVDGVCECGVRVTEVSSD